MLPDFWDGVSILIAVSAFALDVASYRRETRARSAERQRTRVVVRKRVVRLGRWMTWRSSERREDIDRHS